MPLESTPSLPPNGSAIYDPTGEYSAPVGGGVVGTTEQAQNESRSSSIADHLRFAVPGMVAAAVDTVGSSVGFLGQGDVEKYLSTQSEALGNYYTNNKSGLHLAADLATFLIPGTAGAKAVQSGSWLYKTLGGRTAEEIAARGGVKSIVEKLFTSAADVSELSSGLYSYDIGRAAKGSIDFVSRDPVRQKIVADMYKTAASDAVKRYVGSEAAIYATMNQSETFYPSDAGVVDTILGHTIGLGLAQGVEAAFVRSAVRRSLQREEVKDLVGKALNPGDLPLSSDIKGERDFSAFMNAVNANNHASIAATSSDSLVTSNAKRYETLFRDELKTDLEKIYQDGVPGLVSPNAKNAGGVDTLLAASEKNPTVLRGIRALQNMPDNINDLAKVASSAQEQATAAAAKAKKLGDADPLGGNAEAISKLYGEAEVKSKLTPVVIDAFGDVHQVNDVKILYQNKASPEKIKTIPKSQLEDKRYVVDTIDPHTNERSVLGLSDQLLPIYPVDKKFTDLSRYQQSVMYALGQKAIEDFKSGRLLAEKIKVTESTEPFVLDIVSSVLKKNKDFISEFEFPEAAGANPTKWLAQQTLEKKFETYQTLFNKFNSQNNAAFIGPPHSPYGGESFIRFYDPNSISLDDIRYALNLPASHLGNQHPAFQLFRSLSFQGDTKLKEALGSFDDFQGMMKEELLKMGGLAANYDRPEVIDFMRKGSLEVTGSNLAWPKSKGGEYLRSQVAWLKPVPWDLTKTDVDTFAIGKRLDFLSKFSQAPSFVGKIADQAINNAAFQVAKKVDTLADGQQAGRGFFNYQNAATRDLDVFTAADQISAIAENNSRVYMKELFKAHDSAFQKLNSDNTGMFHFAQFVQARRFGFELEKEVENGTNGIRFRLKTAADDFGVTHTDANRRAITKALGEEFTSLPMGDVTYLPDIVASKKAGKLVPLEISSSAFDAVKAMRDMGTELWRSANFFRGLYGRGQLNFQEWHVPPQNLSNQFVKYIVIPAEDGAQPVKTIITGRTATDLERKMATPAVAELSQKKGAFVVDQNDLRNYFDLHDEAFFNLVDFSDGLTQTARSTGSAVSPLLEYGNQVLNDLITGVERQIINTSRRTVGSLFQDEINYARIADRGSQVNAGQPRGTKVDSIWKMYSNRLMGVTEPQSQNVINAEVPYFDQAIQKFKDTIEAIKPKMSFGEGGAAAEKSKDFTRLKEALGDQLPFSDAAEFIDKTYKVRPPKDLQHYSQLLNHVTTKAVLGVFEVGNAAISMFGNLVTMPLVMNNLRRMPYDTEASWRARTGFMGADIGSDVALPNPVRMTAKSMGMLFTKEGQEILSEAQQLGYIQKHVGEFTRVMHQPFETHTKAAINKVVDAMSWVSEKGEQVSRSWAYMAGYKIADMQGITNKYDLHSFANYFADNAIANYRPSNKPRVFQGALGAPLGLFQTYMFNYYNRMFSYIENKDFRSLAMNYGLQAGVFGIGSVPGFQQFNSLYSKAYDYKKDVVDSLDAKYGSSMADLLLHGTISNIPRLFSKDGIALYSRGDVNLSKVPAFISPDNAPIFNLAGNTFKLVGSLIDQFKEGGYPSGQRTLEAIGSYSINRPIARLAELAAGVSTDQRGAVINGDTLEGMSIASRVMGMRPLIEQKNIETNYRIATTEAYQRAVHERTTHDIRALFRGNVSEEKLQNGISKLIMDHLNNGGSPYSVASFIRDAALSAYLTKQESKFLSVIQNPGRLNDEV